MKIAIIGNGFVGKAVANAFGCEIVVADPPQNGVNARDLPWSEIDAAFICVPTPARQDGQVDPTTLIEVVCQIPVDSLAIVKSTVTPEHLVRLAEGRRLVYNPEFLTERSANEDFLKADSLIFGGDPVDCAQAAVLYQEHSKVKPCPIYFTDLATASLCKYALNCHFAAKITFLNELYQVHKKIAGSTWAQFTNIIGADSRLGYSHLQVPGPDGFLGFGGNCFPKDTRALAAFAASQGAPMQLLEKAIEVNEEIRNE